MTARHREHPAPAPLAPWVACLWQRTSDGSDHLALPDGCMDLVWVGGTGLQAVGANTTIFRAERPPAAAAGVRSRPGGAPALLGSPAAL